MRAPYAIAAFTVAITIAAPRARAQIRPSELGSVSQTVDGTKITIEYSRPQARGRSPLFGTRIVPWNESWTPGANWATTFDASKELKLNGVRVPKGTYSVWMTPRATGDWTMALDPRARMFHTEHADSTPQQIRFPVHVMQEPTMDVLTWWFPEVRPDGALLVMQWGTYRASVNVIVQPSGLPEPRGRGAVSTTR
jgi:hypothetical protein